MLIKAKILKGYSIESKEDETIGKVEEFYFDDRHWTIRYIVAHTGSWLSTRQVLISPYAVEAVNADRDNIVVNSTKKQIEGSPLLENEKPISRQFEEHYYGYYSWPRYWGGLYCWGPSPYIDRNRDWNAFTPDDKKWDHHLRSTREVSGYHIQAEDGEIGHVEDFIIDQETWAIRYLFVNTHNFWPGKKVLISPQWIGHVSWSERIVTINLSREVIRQSPEFTNESLLTRDFETSLYGHYNRKGYWVDELVSK